jgi:hypothetical protein
MQEKHQTKALRGNVFLTLAFVAVLAVATFNTGCGASSYQVVREDRPVQFGLNDDGEVESTPLPDDVVGPLTVETRPSWCSRNRVACGLLIGFGSAALTGVGVGLGVGLAPEETVVTHR